MAFLSTACAQRERIPELMDDPAIDPAEHRRALAALARINRFTNSAGVLWPAIRESGAPTRTPNPRARCRDRFGRRARGARGPGAEATASRSKSRVRPAASSPSTRPATAHTGIEFFVHDAIRDRLPLGFDVVTCFAVPPSPER